MAASDSSSVNIAYPWQQPLWQRLNQQLASSQLPHALLLSGSSGIGKMQLAQAFSQLLLCATPEHGVACGHCKPCQLFAAQTHPDFHLLVPEDSKQIKIEEVRDLQTRLATSAQQGGRKVVLLGPAEALNLNAANALLKTIEEPTAETHILMVTHQLSAVLPTIKSRCQIVKMATPERQACLEWLTTIVGGRAQELLDAAAGAPVSALRLLDDDRLATRKLVTRQLQDLRERKTGPVGCAAKLNNVALEDLCVWLCEQLEADAKAWVCGQSGTDRSRQNVFLLRDKVVGLLRRVRAGANPNRQLALEELLMDYARLI